jgi:FtsP/CotA-like multicopper oxidase with cupredoxin domain
MRASACSYGTQRKETFFLRQDTVRVITHFEAERADVAQFPNRREFRGTYVFHCHVIEHEDHMMMSQFSVVGPDGKLIASPRANCPPPVPD